MEMTPRKWNAVLMIAIGLVANMAGQSVLPLSAGGGFLWPVLSMVLMGGGLCLFALGIYRFFTRGPGPEQ
jgi:uncharacterized membrane protein